MGICESAHHGKNLDKNDTKKESPEINQNEQTLEYQNLKTEESGVRPSIFNQTDNKNSSDPETKEDNEKPELVQYDRDNSYCNNNNKTKTSMFSSLSLSLSLLSLLPSLSLLSLFSLSFFTLIISWFSLLSLFDE